MASQPPVRHSSGDGGGGSSGSSSGSSSSGGSSSSSSSGSDKPAPKERTLVRDNAILREFDDSESPDLLVLYHHL